MRLVPQWQQRSVCARRQTDGAAELLRLRWHPGVLIGSTAQGARRARLARRRDSSTPIADRPCALAEARAVPKPQNGSTTVLAPVEATNRTAASHAARPIARDQVISPSAGRTSAVEAPGASRRARLTHKRCAKAGRPNVTV